MKHLSLGYQFKPLKKKSKRKAWFLLLMLVIFIFTYLLLKSLFKSDLISPLSSIKQAPLEKVVENNLIGVKGTYGIVVKNLKTGESYHKNEHQVFEAGSLYKLWVMATTYQQIQENKLQKEQVLSGDIEVLNRKFSIDPEFAEFKEGQFTLSVKDALHQMITISHNYSALMLTEKIKLSSVAAFLKAFQFNESSVSSGKDSPKVTAFDAALYLEKLYQGKLASVENTYEMIDLLKKQQLNNGLPKYLPETIKMAHKTGEIGWFKHDAGIIFTNNDKGDYIIVVLSESNSPSFAQEKIASISKSVFDYFNSL